MITKEDKELWLKYAKQIKDVEAGKAFIVPTILPQHWIDILQDHCAEPADLINDMMREANVPKRTRDRVTTTNRKRTAD